MSETRQVRAIPAEFETREDENELSISGYWSVFNSVYEIAPGMTESVAPGAFSNTLAGDIRALINHDSTLVLGRTKAHTLELREDEHGLWGKVIINPNDVDAMNLYNRVKRGDVDQCSFGFDIVSQESDFRDDGSIHWTIKEVVLHEISACTFPAYEQTNISARTREREDIKQRASEVWREQMRKKLKGEGNEVESNDAA